MNRDSLASLLRWVWLLALVAPKQALIPDELRLIPNDTQPNNPCRIAGRIEIYHNDTQGWLCSGGLHSDVAKVVCRMFGFSTGNVVGGSFFGAGNGSAWCVIGDKIAQCPTNSRNQRANCNSNSNSNGKTAGVCCSNDVRFCESRNCTLEGSVPCNPFSDACIQNECGASLVESDLDRRRCVSNGECTNTTARLICNCDPGYVGDGDKCTDIDECVIGGGNDCDENAECTNTDGNFTCTCSEGFSRDGVTCKRKEAQTTATTTVEMTSEPQSWTGRPTASQTTVTTTKKMTSEPQSWTGVGSQSTVTSTMMAPVAQHETEDSSPDYILIGSVSGAGALVVIIIIIIIVVICITRNKRQTREGKPVNPNGVVVAPNSGATPMTHNMSYSAPPSQDNTYIDVMPPETDDQYASLYAEPLAEGAAYTKLSGENLTPGRAMPRDVGNAEYDHIGNNGTKDHHTTMDTSLYDHTAGVDSTARVSGQYDQLNGTTEPHKGAIRDDTYNLPDEDVISGQKLDQNEAPEYDRANPAFVVHDDTYNIPDEAISGVKSYQNDSENQKEAENEEHGYDRTNPAFVIHEETSYDRLGHGQKLEGDIANVQEQSAQSRHNGHYDHVVMNSQGAEYSK